VLVSGFVFVFAAGLIGGDGSVASIMAAEEEEEEVEEGEEQEVLAHLPWEEDEEGQCGVCKKEALVALNGNNINSEVVSLMFTEQGEYGY